MLIRPKIPIAARRFLKATKFWQDNFIVLKELKHFKGIVITVFVCTILAAFLEGVSVGLIASFLQGVTNHNEPPIVTGIQWLDIVFLGTQASPQMRLYRLSALILLVVWIKTSLRYFGAYNIKLAQSNVCDRLRQRTFEQLQSLSLTYYSTSHSGKLINTITTEINQIKQMFQLFAIIVVKGSLLIAYAVSIFWLSWQLSVTAILLFALLTVILTNLIARVREASFAVPKANENSASIIIQLINGIKTVKSYVTEDFERKKFYRSSKKIIRAEQQVAYVSALVEPLSEALGSTILIVMVIMAFNLFIVSGQLQASTMLTFMFALLRILPLVSQINRARENIGGLQGSVYNVKNLLKTEDKPYLNSGSSIFPQLKQAIRFNNVSFSYKSNNLILENINLTIEKGKATALVGSSGAGKSTLADLIPRFYDPVRGTISFDGEDSRNFDVSYLRRRISIVSQDTFIFNATVKDNIAYGLEGIPENKVWEVASLARAKQFIRDLPEGLDTVLGDRGVRLSGGQRQRIAIARAILRNSDILILDEATSALDSVTEQLIQESLETLSKGKTVITIAHRLSTIAKADKVVVLEKGRIVEQGNYHDLLASKGGLWKYHQMQYDLSVANSS